MEVTEEIKQEQHRSEMSKKKDRSWQISSKIFDKRVLFILKVAVTLIILWLIFRRIDFSEVFRSATGIRFSILIVLLIITITKFYIQLKNWESCLKITVNYTPVKNEILKSHFIGTALRFLIPGGHATFGKVYFVTNPKRATLFSIGIERFMQTWTILWCGSWAGFFYFRQYSLYLRLIVVFLITIIPLIVYWSSRIFKKNSWKRYCTEFIRLVPLITLRQLFFFFLTVVQYYLIITQFLSIAFFRVLITVPLILLANIIPISYAGLGLRESFAIHLLGEYGIQPEIAVMTSLVIFILNSVLPALIGAYLILKTAKK